MTGKAILLLPVVVLSNVAGNFALGWGMKHAPGDAGPLLSLLQPAVIAGIALLICWTLARIALLGEADLTWVLPVTSVGYVLNVVSGAVLLGEHVTPQRWLGALLIVAGASLVGAERTA